MHDLEFEHLHVSAEDAAINEVAWAADNVELTTVGIDIGSSTSHLMFARVHLQRLSAALSSRFVVVGRKILWQSPILLTPYRPDYTIDVDECHARGRTHHVHCAGQQKAAATRFHAEIWWTWRHPCTSSVEPDIEIGERVIGVSATETPADGSGANECISGFETVIDPLAAQRWRIVGQDRFDVMLVVPNQIVH